MKVNRRACVCGKSMLSNQMSTHSVVCPQWKEHITTLRACKEDVRAKVESIGINGAAKLYNVSPPVLRDVLGLTAKPYSKIPSQVLNPVLRGQECIEASVAMAQENKQLKQQKEELGGLRTQIAEKDKTITKLMQEQNAVVERNQLLAKQLAEINKRHNAMTAIEIEADYSKRVMDGR